MSVKLARENDYDVIIMDINMPGIGGIEATRRIRQYKPKQRIIILSVNDKAPFPSKLLEAGAAAYLTKGSNKDELLQAIHLVHEGKRYVAQNIAQQVAIDMMPGGNKSPFDDLSDREMQTIMYLAKGYDISKIADQLNLSPKTISTYKTRAFEKMKIKSQVDLTRVALDYGLIEQGQS